MKNTFAILLLAVMLFGVLANPQGPNRRGERHRNHGNDDGRHGGKHSGWECKNACFAHCLAGTTADVQDFCNLTGTYNGWKV